MRKRSSGGGGSSVCCRFTHPPIGPFSLFRSLSLSLSLFAHAPSVGLSRARLIGRMLQLSLPAFSCENWVRMSVRHSHGRPGLAWQEKLHKEKQERERAEAQRRGEAARQREEEAAAAAAAAKQAKASAARQQAKAAQQQQQQQQRLQDGGFRPQGSSGHGARKDTGVSQPAAAAKEWRGWNTPSPAGSTQAAPPAVAVSPGGSPRGDEQGSPTCPNTPLAGLSSLPLPPGERSARRLPSATSSSWPSSSGATRRPAEPTAWRADASGHGHSSAADGRQQGQPHSHLSRASASWVAPSSSSPPRSNPELAVRRPCRPPSAVCWLPASPFSRPNCVQLSDPAFLRAFLRTAHPRAAALFVWHAHQAPLHPAPAPGGAALLPGGARHHPSERPDQEGGWSFKGGVAPPRSNPCARHNQHDTLMRAVGGMRRRLRSQAAG
eukprot:COSAG01_NODE_6845_length_3472_cov_1.489772_2_plen_437_part_00